jgi:hypothetical protein
MVALWPGVDSGDSVVQAVVSAIDGVHGGKAGPGQ